MHEDPALLQAFWDGETEALTRVYVRFSEPVKGFVRTGFSLRSAPPMRIAGVQDDAALADVVHEVFVRAFRDTARRAYDGKRPFTPYLLQIAKNVCIDRHRRARRERLELLGDLHELEAVQHAAVDAAQEPAQDDRFRHLEGVTRAFVEQLDPEGQRFVELRFRQELSQAAAAAALGVTRRHVRTLEERVLKGLRRHLQKIGTRG